MRLVLFEDNKKIKIISMINNNCNIDRFIIIDI